MIRQLRKTLRATGYYLEDAPAPGLVLKGTATPPRTRTLDPDAWWSSGSIRESHDVANSSNPTVLFKYSESVNGSVADWQQDAWNLGCAPLLWVVAPNDVKVYNGYGKPRHPADASRNLLNSFSRDTGGMSRLDSFAGRLAMETGKFWRSAPKVTRKTGVFVQLLAHLGAIEQDLVQDGLQRLEAQALICRTILSKYLIDRGIITARKLNSICGSLNLPDALDDRDATRTLFHWLRETFNGDMFPPNLSVPKTEHLRRIAAFLRTDGPGGQLSLFPYRFDVIPVELISSIYERFVHSSEQHDAGQDRSSGQETADAHYTPLTAVNLVLDEVFDGLSGNETVIDLTCGSGIFLVEALRRLVRLKAEGQQPTREMIRRTLHKQVYGIDISASAVQVAAFSLYLAALELDPDTSEPESLRFEPLVNRSLFAEDVNHIKSKMLAGHPLSYGGRPRAFDVIVGNPPRSNPGRRGAAERWQTVPDVSRSPRGVSLDYLHLAKSFADQGTKYGMLVSATKFFSSSRTGLRAAQLIVESLGSVTLVDLSSLRDWLFSGAKMPAMAVLSGSRDQAGSMELVRVHRAPEGARSHDIGAAPRKVIRMPLESWKKRPELFKTSLLGGDHDLLLLNSLGKRCAPLKDALNNLGKFKLAAGLIVGNRSRETTHLEGVPYAARGAIGRFNVARNLALCPHFAECPRSRTIYRAPLLLVPQYLHKSSRAIESGRLSAAVTEQDLVYAFTYFGVSLVNANPDIAYLLAGIVSSSVWSWCTLMTASRFGIRDRSTLEKDMSRIPTPDLAQTIRSDAGSRIVRLVRRFHEESPSDQEWRGLDEAVCDLYGLDAEERIVVDDGRLRASWEWRAGQRAADAAAETDQVRKYAGAFLLHIDAWFYSDNKRSFLAEIFETGPESPLRVVRFVLVDRPPPSRMEVVEGSTLDEILTSIDARLGISIAREIVGVRELIVHSRNEVVIVKPSSQRFWLGVAGLDDARAVLIKSFTVERR
ncbi:MAG: N-6 DNA methylase [Bacteroidota bacterium]|nr:N-6 DNA methylase [Bacteroidota bacterium]